MARYEIRKLGTEKHIDKLGTNICMAEFWGIFDSQFVSVTVSSEFRHLLHVRVGSFPHLPSGKFIWWIHILVFEIKCFPNCLRYLKWAPSKVRLQAKVAAFKAVGCIFGFPVLSWLAIKLIWLTLTASGLPVPGHAGDGSNELKCSIFLCRHLVVLQRLMAQVGCACLIVLQRRLDYRRNGMLAVKKKEKSKEEHYVCSTARIFSFSFVALFLSCCFRGGERK